MGYYTHFKDGRYYVVGIDFKIDARDYIHQDLFRLFSGAEPRRFNRRFLRTFAETCSIHIYLTRILNNEDL